jgi:hypothetical protein
MGFGRSRNSGITYIPNYEIAAKRYDNTKPIRGRAEDKRPLGQRRSVDSYWFVKHEDKVECYLYQTPVVTYHADGRVGLCSGRWSTLSTAAFINELSPFHARLYDGSIVVQINHPAHSGEPMEFRLGTGKDAVPLEFKRNEQGVWEVLNPEKEYDYRINRKAANNVRRRFKEFKDYLIGSVKLRENGDFSMQELAEMGIGRGPSSPEINAENRTHILNMMQDPDKFYEASLWVAGNVGIRKWGRGTVSLKNEYFAAKALDEFLLKNHANEVLDMVEIKYVKRNRYKNWVK